MLNIRNIISPRSNCLEHDNRYSTDFPGKNLITEANLAEYKEIIGS